MPMIDLSRAVPDQAVGRQVAAWITPGCVALEHVEKETGLFR